MGDDVGMACSRRVCETGGCTLVLKECEQAGETGMIFGNVIGIVAGKASVCWVELAADESQ